MPRLHSLFGRAARGPAPVIAFAFAALAITAAAAPPAAAVRLARVPAGGLQPQVATDTAGRIHWLYFTGNPAGGNLEYATSADGGRDFSPPLRVNSIPNTALALGNMRGGHLAIAPDGAVYVAWVGINHDRVVPMWFTRLTPGAKAFAPQQNLAPPMPLDGGAVAVNAAGVVEVFWHGLAPGKTTEGERQAWVTRSTDGGKKFAAPRPVWRRPTGACGCCGMAAATRGDEFFLIYRAARTPTQRDLFLLHSNDGGRDFEGEDFSPWQVGYCVMSTARLLETPAGLFAAWEQKGQVWFAEVGGDGKIGTPHAAPGPGRDRKYPALAVNRSGQALFAWTEGMGWNRGGSLHWQIYDANGHPVGSPGSAPGVPTWSLVAAFAHPGGSFTILY